MADRFYREVPVPDEKAELRYDEGGLHIYWFDPVEGCWVAFRRVDCVGEEELPERRLPAPETDATDDQVERIARILARTSQFTETHARVLVKAAQDIAKAERASVVPEEPKGEHVFIERYGVYHAKFGGIGGDVSSLTLTREAWKALGEADVLAVSVMPVEQEGETDVE